MFKVKSNFILIELDKAFGQDNYKITGIEEETVQMQIGAAKFVVTNELQVLQKVERSGMTPDGQYVTIEVFDPTELSDILQSHLTNRAINIAAGKLE